jgi:hypothetical protein
MSGCTTKATYTTDFIFPMLTHPTVTQVCHSMLYLLNTVTFSLDSSKNHPFCAVDIQEVKYIKKLLYSEYLNDETFC